MSATGDRRRRDGRTAGFTLIEMLVVVAVLALISGIAFPAIERLARAQAFAGAATGLDTRLHAARARAIRSGRTVSFDPAAEPSGGGTITSAPPRMTFYADGSASGGRVTLVDGPRTRAWFVTAATGTIERRS